MKLDKTTMMIIILASLTAACSLIASFFMMDRVKNISVMESRLSDVEQELLKQRKNIDSEKFKQLENDVESLKTNNQVAPTTANVDNSENTPNTDNSNTVGAQTNNTSIQHAKTKLNLRKNASKSSNIIRVVSTNEDITVIPNSEVVEGEYTWIKVIDSKNNEGWLAKKYLQ